MNFFIKVVLDLFLYFLVLGGVIGLVIFSAHSIGGYALDTVFNSLPLWIFIWGIQSLFFFVLLIFERSQKQMMCLLALLIVPIVIVNVNDVYYLSIGVIQAMSAYGLSFIVFKIYKKNRAGKK